MWWAGSKAHDVYLGTRAVAVCLGSQVLLAESVDNFDGALVIFGGWLATISQREQLHVWLSGGLCRPFVVPAIQGVKASAERLKVASALAPQQSGLTGECEVWLERSRALDSSIAVAVQKEKLSRIQDAVTSAPRAVGIRSIRPWWCEALRHFIGHESQMAALGVQDCDSMTVLAGRSDGFDVASTYTPVTDEKTARSVLARALMMVDGIEGGTTIARLVWQRLPRQDPVPDMALGALADFSR